MPLAESRHVCEGAAVHALSSPQRDIYHDQLMKGRTPTYNIGGYVDLFGGVDAARFRQALQLAVRKHDCLRLRLVSRGEDTPGQVITQELAMSLPLLDVSDREAPEQHARAWIRECINTPFDLFDGPLFRCALLKLSESRFQWFICAHHIVVDGWGIDTIIQSVASLYNALANGEAPDAEAPSYLAFVANDAAYLASTSFDRDRDHWLGTYPDVPDPLLAPRHRDTVVGQPFSTGECSWRLSRDLDEKIDALVATHGSTRFQVFLGLFQAFFLRLEQRDELAVGLSVLNRKDAAARRTAGMFTNVLPMRLAFDTSRSFVALLEAIAPALRQAYRHQRFPVGALNEGLDLFREHRAQVYDLSISYEHGGTELFFGTVRGWVVKCTNDHEGTPLRLCVRDDLGTGESTMFFIFGRAYFDDGEIATLRERFIVFMEALLADAHAPLSSIPVVLASERKQFADWNATDVAYPDTCLHTWFERCVDRQPDAIALVHGDVSLTYAELNRRANRLAHHLLAMGVQPDDRIALCLERSVSMVVGLLAVLKAGGAYVPIDPTYPPERLAYLLHDAQPRLLLTDETGCRALGASVDATTHLRLDLPSPPWITLPASNPEVAGVTSQHLAYVIYTSGSTGQPKGVMVEHRHVAHQVVALQRAYDLRPGDRLLQFASLAFDMSVEEIFPALVTGATLVLRTDACLASPMAFAAFCAEHRLTWINLPSTFWAQLPTERPELPLPDTLRRVSVGGDAISPSAVAAWFARAGHRPTLFNAYGPTEATVNATLLRMDEVPRVPSIGRPVSNAQVHLLDAVQKPVPVGAVGELYIGGSGVARGYLHRPTLTAERFIDDPFANRAGARMYRTGDLGRYLPDGAIEFLGRNDHQVKVRGYRIELGEIEARLATHSSVHETVVLALGEGLARRLVAYVVARGSEADDAALAGLLRAHLAVDLPDYMLPSAFVRLDAFPLTPNGKLDRKALPEPGDEAFALRPYEAPRGEVETELATLWRELLGIERIGRHDHFFELGGHSLVAIRLLGRMARAFDRVLPLATLFSHPTVAELAVAVEALGREDAHPVLPPIRPVVHGETLPLSYAQQRLWFMDQLDRDSAIYHVSLVVRMTGEVDGALLHRSLDRLLARHEALRTVFRAIDGEPHAALLPTDTAFPFVEHDLRGTSDPDGALVRYTDDNARTPYDLEHGPLVRACLVRVADRDCTLLLGMHHIVADGWSLHLLAREIGTLYTAFAQGQDDALPPLPVQYPDYAAWQRAVLTPQRLQRQVDYWRHTLAGAPDLLNLPTDRPRPARQSFAGAVVPLRVDATVAGRLRQVCARHGVSLFMLLTAAWSSVLARLSGQDDVVIGTLSANRGQREIEPLIGFFVSTLALRLDLSGEPDTAGMLARVRQRILAAQENQDLPFEQVVELARPSRRLDHSPLFQVLIAWQSNDRGRFALPGIEVSQAEMSLAAIRYDLELHLYEDEDAIVGGLGYATALFDEASIERHVGYLGAVLDAMAADTTLPLSRTELSGADERALLERWNRTEVSVAREEGIHRLFERQAARSPDAIALIHGEARLAYGALNREANRRARHLRALGIGAEGRTDQRVALCAERGFAMVTAMLAILKAGACYVPLDPAYPAERLQQVLDEAGATLLLADGAGRRAVGDRSLATHRTIDLDRAPPEEDALASDDLDPLPGATDTNLAYVIYTSGSTGTPKGVAMPHGPLVNLVHWQRTQSEHAGAPAPRTLQYAALGFDVAFQEIFATLCFGGALVLVDAAVRLQFEVLVDVLREQRVQRVFLPYIALQSLAEAIDEGSVHGELLPDLREVAVAGEQLRLTPQIKRLFARLPACALHNHYGPTETHVVTAQTLGPGSIGDSPSHVPIGRPIANARAYVLDTQGVPVPLGAVGELYIGGVGIARGYLDRDELTAQRFVRDPFDTRPDARMYRTGDLARYLPDGRLVCLGRNDHQVKVRGFRIELGDIEAHLADHPAVRECAVIARADTRGETQLVAYVVAPCQDDGLAATLHAHLAGLLPGYMVPAAFVRLAAIPLTAHGKLDRRALPLPDEQAFARSVYAPPQGEIEAGLAALWQDLLGVERVGRHDHFFELGGHSLIAVRLLSRLSQRFGVALPLAELFAHPVLSELAGVLADSRLRIGDTGLEVIPRASRGDSAPLSHAQQRLWFLAQLEGDSATYHIPLTVRLDGDLDVAALRSAFRRLLARHESLRTVFVAEHGRPHTMVLDEDRGPDLHHDDLRDRPDIEAALTRFLAEDRNRPFDLAAGPLVRASLVRVGESRHVLQLTLHHLVADGWSLGIVAAELGALYVAGVDGVNSLLPPLPIQYADYALWERDRMSGDRLTAQAAYWRRQLADAPSLLTLPTDRPRPARQSFAGAFLPLTLDPTLTRALKRVAHKHGTTLFMVVLAAWAAVLSRLAGQSEVMIGTPTAGRGREELEALIGFFINTLALRIDLAAPHDVASLLDHVRQVALDAQAHQDLPFDQVVEIAQVPRRVDRTPLVQVLFAWQSHDEGRLSLPGIAVEPLPAFDWVKFDIELILSDVDGSIQGGFNYATALFDDDTMARHAGYLHTVLEAMVADDAATIAAIPLLAVPERRQLLDEWNRTEASYPAQTGMHQLVERWARDTPDAPALVDASETLSYAQWNARANGLAHELIARGVRPGGRVALCVGKGSAMFVALLAVLKTGAAYVPLDPAYASARLDHILDDAAPGLLLYDAAGRAALGATALAARDALDLADWLGRDGEETDNPDVGGFDARMLAYVIYTSGSTGKPKGVMVEHHAVVNLALSLSERLGVDANSRISQFASPGFDASVFESVMALATGSALYVPTQAERLNPAAFLAFIGRHGITHASLPPAFLQGHLETPRWSHRPTLVFVGDASAPGLVATWQRHARMANAYGPTEITVCATVWLAPDEPGAPASVPIGRPLANTRLYVLDEQGLPVPCGSVGELHIGGVGVGRGYLDRPVLTAERFVPDPFDARPGARMYRTGDLVRYLADGNLVFVGRNDHQVKLRGFRIELGEIESQLAMHPMVRECVVMAREDRPGEQRLVAYVVVDADGDADVALLRDHLAVRLPDYMLPAAFVVLRSMPLTAHGKLDRKALPMPDDGAYARRAWEPPHAGAENTLARLWREVLGVERVGRHDHFFELGGHSMLVVQLVMRINEVMDMSVAVRDVFRCPVLTDMAQLMSPADTLPPSLVLDLDREIVLDEAIRADARPRDHAPPAHILLTGASGFLGVFLLASLLRQTQATVHCLVRCIDPADGWSRLAATIRRFGIAGIDPARVVIVPGDLAQPKLGLTEACFDRLAGMIDTIHHNGAWVDSLHTYASLKAANVTGTQEILRLAARGTPKHIHYVSTLSTIPPVESAGPDIVKETQLAEHWRGLPSGYAQSKWVAERLLRVGGERGIPYTVYRPTHIAGARGNGASNPTDTWSLFIDACLVLECVPDIDTPINSLPVDDMADAIVTLSLRGDMRGRSLNLTNPRSFMLGELTRQVAAIDELDVQRVDYRKWRQQLGEHPATGRLATVMPVELSELPVGTKARAPIELGNAMVEFAGDGVRATAMTPDLLCRYVRWRYGQMVQPA
ncbi:MULTISPECIES: non-ribosomal peptide synthetase [unclassified Luteibacter]|uniref:non-ribosomal peptide synthetase n=1 Tax=Luteibacter sp. PvP019 TaxID=3156436 RepID=UPI00339AFED4